MERTRGGERRAGQTAQREEREAVRSPEGEGDVEITRRADRELTRRLESRWEEVGLGHPAAHDPSGRNDGPEEGGRAQGRQGHRAEASLVTVAKTATVTV